MRQPGSSVPVTPSRVPMWPCVAHLKQAVSPRIQGPLQLQHVAVLLRVDELIGEEPVDASREGCQVAVGLSSIPPLSADTYTSSPSSLNFMARTTATTACVRDRDPALLICATQPLGSFRTHTSSCSLALATPRMSVCIMAVHNTVFGRFFAHDHRHATPRLTPRTICPKSPSCISPLDQLGLVRPMLLLP